MFRDAIGREHQLATVQLDFNLPERFSLSYTNEHGEAERPVVIHRAISGSIERFLGVAIEHFAGAFPVWMSPTQVTIIPVNGELHGEYAHTVLRTLRAQNIRADIYDYNESLGKRIREAKKLHTPYVIVIGDKEKESGLLTVETRTDKLENISHEDFIKRMQKEITERSL